MKNLANKVVKKLIKKKLNVSFAESCTGGLLSSLITSLNENSLNFLSAAGVIETSTSS